MRAASFVRRATLATMILGGAAPGWSGQTIQLAPTLPNRPAAGSEPPPGVLVEDQSWRMCRVKTSLLLNMPDRSKVIGDQEQLLALGEAIDFEKDVPITWGTKAALVHVHARVRASVAKTPGVLYVVTTDALLSSVIGFESDDVGRDQVRNAILDITGPGTRLHEAYVSPEIQARIVLAVSADPVFGAEEVSVRDLLNPPPVDIRRFKVEAFLKEKDKLTLLDEADLSAIDGSETVYAMARFAADAPKTPEALKLGSTVQLVEPRRVPESGFEQSHQVGQATADRSFLERHSSDPDSGFLQEHEVVADSSDDPHHYTIRGKNNKISKSKREKAVKQQQIQSVQDWAIERSKTLPTGEAIPDGFARESLELHITPLHATESTLQAEIRIEGHIHLPHEDAMTPIATRTIEHLPMGEAFDVALSELVHDKASEYDYLLRITPEP